MRRFAIFRFERYVTPLRRLMLSDGAAMPPMLPSPFRFRRFFAMLLFHSAMDAFTDAFITLMPLFSATPLMPSCRCC